MAGMGAQAGKLLLDGRVGKEGKRGCGREGVMVYGCGKDQGAGVSCHNPIAQRKLRIICGSG